MRHLPEMSLQLMADDKAGELGMSRCSIRVLVGISNASNAQVAAPPAGQAPCETSHDGETVDEMRRPACFQRAAMWIAGMRQLRGSRNEPYNMSSMRITTAMYEIDGSGYQFLGFGIVWNNTSPTNSARCYVCMYVCTYVCTYVRISRCMP